MHARTGIGLGQLAEYGVEVEQEHVLESIHLPFESRVVDVAHRINVAVTLGVVAHPCPIGLAAHWGHQVNEHLGHTQLLQPLDTVGDHVGHILGQGHDLSSLHALYWISSFMQGLMTKR